MRRRFDRPAYTLLEVLLVIGLFALLAGMVLPNLMRRIEQARLPESANQMRALLQLTRANAMLDGKRYRVRFAREDELDATGERRQPIVEIEADPLNEPEVYRPVLASWARDETFGRGIRCAHVRLGKPSIDLLLGEDKAQEEMIQQDEEDLSEDLGEQFDEGFPPLLIEPDGTCEWVTFLLTDAPEEVTYDDLDPEDHTYGQVEVIMDGLIGLAWLQRPLYVDELEMMREHGWPPVLRKDFLTPVALTEKNVLEIHDQWGRR